VIKTNFIFQLHKSLEDLQQAIDLKILPKEYGGEIPLSEMIGNSLNYFLE
jgi:hypothetical protein